MAGTKQRLTLCTLHRRRRATGWHATNAAAIAAENHLLVFEMTGEIITLGNTYLAATNFLTVLAQFAMFVTKISAAIDAISNSLSLAAGKSAAESLFDSACLPDCWFH